MQHSQRGAALLVALILLLILTLIGVSGMNSVGLQERMAGSLSLRADYFEAAEAGLRDAERYLSAAALPAFANADGRYLFERNQCRFDTLADAAQFYGACSSMALSASGLTRRTGEGSDSIDVRYLIELLDGSGLTRDKGLELGEIEELALYRITVMAAARTDGNAVADPMVVLQSTYLR